MRGVRADVAAAAGDTGEDIHGVAGGRAAGLPGGPALLHRGQDGLPARAGRPHRQALRGGARRLGSAFHTLRCYFKPVLAGWRELRAVAGDAGAGERGDPGAGGLGGQADVLTGRQPIQSIFKISISVLF